MLRILLEGPDGAGKTTLGEELVKLLGGKVKLFRNSQPPAPPTFWFNIDQMIQHADREAIIDRAWPSDVVYSPFRKDPVPIVAYQRMFQRVQMGLSIHMVMCTTPYDVCLATWSKRKEQELVKEQDAYWLIYQGYQDLRVRWNDVDKFPYRPYKYTDKRYTPQALLNAVMNRTKPIQVENLGPGIGHFRPKNILIVGERPNAATTKHDLPFVAPYGSSVFLTEKLADLNIPESDLYWINAYNLAGQEQTGGTWVEYLDPPFIVALGRNAETWCRHNCPQVKDVRYVPHPSVWKRFYSKEEYTPLIQALQKGGGS